LANASTSREDGVEVKPVIRAAGGVVSRVNENRRREVLIVYRAHREDWTFPKGKRRHDEVDEACARREVEEETGLRCALGAELPTTKYSTRSGQRKRVRYWVMRAIDGRAGPRNEVDDVRWVSLGMAATLLTYARDRALLAAFARAGGWRAGTPSRHILNARVRRSRRG
jgi:8-oxo-dGTP diphosphatase